MTALLELRAGLLTDVAFCSDRAQYLRLVQHISKLDEIIAGWPKSSSEMHGS